MTNDNKPQMTNEEAIAAEQARMGELNQEKINTVNEKTKEVVLALRDVFDDLQPSLIPLECRENFLNKDGHVVSFLMIASMPPVVKKQVNDEEVVDAAATAEALAKIEQEVIDSAAAEEQAPAIDANDIPVEEPAQLTEEETKPEVAPEQVAS